MLLARFVVLCFLLALACAQPAEAIDEALVAAEASLSKPSASLVVFEYREDPNSATRSGYPKVFLSFLEIPSGAGKNALVIERKNGLQMLEVTSGSYYIRQVATDFFASSSSPKSAPDKDAQLLKIPPGGVAYLGDVRWTEDMGLQMAISKQGLLKLQKKAELHKLPLYLVGFGSKPQLVSWD